MFLPLFAGAVTDEQLPKVLARLSDPEQFWPAYPVPSTALNSPKYELTRYWRGPTWPVTNLFIIEGLMRYAPRSEQARQMAEHLIDTTLEMIARDGFYEYYDPTKGVARPGRTDNATQFGFATFSWSAAIFIQLAQQYRS
jgi:glycogen debranching enzyme